MTPLGRVPLLFPVAPVAEGVWEWMGGSMTPVGVDEAEGEGVRYEVVGGGFYGVDGDETGSESGRDTPGSARAGLDGLGCEPMRDSAKLMSETGPAAATVEAGMGRHGGKETGSRQKGCLQWFFPRGRRSSLTSFLTGHRESPPTSPSSSPSRKRRRSRHCCRIHPLLLVLLLLLLLLASALLGLYVLSAREGALVEWIRSAGAKVRRESQQAVPVVGWERSTGGVGSGQGGWEKVGGMEGTGWMGGERREGGTVEMVTGGTGGGGAAAGGGELGVEVGNQEREQALQEQGIQEQRSQEEGLQEQRLREGEAEGQAGDGGEKGDVNGGASGGMVAESAQQGGEGGGAVTQGEHVETGAGGESGGGEQGGSEPSGIATQEGSDSNEARQETAEQQTNTEQNQEQPANTSSISSSSGDDGSSSTTASELWRRPASLMFHTRTSRRCREQRTMAACGPRQGVVIARGSLEQRMEAVCATEALTVLANTRFRALWTLRPRPRFFPKRSHSLPQSRNAGGVLEGGRQQRRLLGEITGEEELRRLREARRRRMRRRGGVGGGEGEKRQEAEARSGEAEGSMAGEVGMVRFGDLFDAHMPVDVQENATEFLLMHVVAGEKLMRREISFIRCPEPSAPRVASGVELLRVAPDVRRYAQEVSRMRQATGWSPQQEGISQEMNSQGWDSQGSASSNSTRVESGADRYGHWTARLQLYTVRGLVLPDFADRRVACRYEEEVRACLGKLQPSDAVLSLIRQEEEEGGEGEEEREKREGAGDGENGSEGMEEEEGSRGRGVGERRDGSSIGEIVARSTAVYLEARALPCAGCPPADLLNCTMRRIAYQYMRTHAPSPSSSSSSYSSSSSSSSSDSSRLLPDFLVGAYWPSDAQTLISAFHPLRRPYLLRLTRRRQVACPSPPPLALRPERGSVRSEEQMGMRGIKYRRAGWRTQGAGRGETQGGDREGTQGAQGGQGFQGGQGGQGGQGTQGGQQQDSRPQLRQQQQVRFVDPPRAAGQGVALDLRVVSAVGTGTQGTGGGWQGAGGQGAGAQGGDGQGGGGQGRDWQGGGGQKGQYWAMKQRLKQLAQERKNALEGDRSGGALGGSGSAVQGGFAQGGGGEGGNGQKGQYWAMKQRLKQLAREQQRRRDVRGGNGSGAALGGSGSGALNRRRLLGAELATFETSQESGGALGGSGSRVPNRRRLLVGESALTWRQLAELQEEEAARKAGASKRRDDRLLYSSTAADFIRAQMAFRLHRGSTFSSSTTTTTTTSGEGGSLDDTIATSVAADAIAAVGWTADELSVCQAPPLPPVIKSRAARHMIVDGETPCPSASLLLLFCFSSASLLLLPCFYCTSLDHGYWPCLNSPGESRVYIRASQGHLILHPHLHTLRHAQASCPTPTPRVSLLPLPSPPFPSLPLPSPPFPSLPLPFHPPSSRASKGHVLLHSQGCMHELLLHFTTSPSPASVLSLPSLPFPIPLGSSPRAPQGGALLHSQERLKAMYCYIPKVASKSFLPIPLPLLFHLPYLPSLPPVTPASPSERLKAVYCYIPKVACTSWKLWFQQQRGRTTPDDIEHVHDSDTSGLDQLWHAFTESEAIRVLTRPDMFRFTFVRNPFSRVASAYLNKHAAWADPKDRLQWNK
ncbi:unnamed protein product, partial [Closterium sp. NIES-53]